MRQIFPALSNLLSLEDRFLNDLLIELGLSSSWGSPLHDKWDNFKGEFKIDIELAEVTLNYKHWLYLRVGSWRKGSHPHISVAAIWKSAIQRGGYPIPKLRISALIMRFASAIGDLQFNLDLNDDSENDSKSGTESKNESENESISSSKIEIATCKSVDQPRDAALSVDVANNSDLSVQEFPLLHSLGIHSEKHMDALIREVVKYNSRKTISFVQANNRTGFLLPLASARSTERYLVEFGKCRNNIQEIVRIISGNANCSQEEAAKCFITATFNNFEEGFVSMDMMKGVIPNVKAKMDISSVEAMLSESNLNTKNSHALFKHLNQIFWQYFFLNQRRNIKSTLPVKIFSQQWTGSCYRTRPPFITGIRSLMS